MSKTTLALALLALLACAPKPGTEQTASDSPAAAVADPSAVRQAIEATNVKFADALNKGNVDSMLAAYGSDAIVMQPNQPVWRGHEGIRSGGQGMFAAATLSNVTFHTEDVQVAGDFAIETGRYEMTVTPKQGKAINDKGKYMTVWQRQADGSWKIIRDISNSDLPATG